MARKKKLISVHDIVIGDRLRTLDEKHVADLARSIAEDGLLQAVVLRKSDNKLIAGGHRLAAHFALLEGQVECDNPENFSMIGYQYFEEYLEDTGRIKRGDSISDALLRKMEVEENVRRKDMHWSEVALGIEDYHRLCSRENTEGGTWTQGMTGKLLGVEQSYVSVAIRVAREIRKGNVALTSCDSMKEALQLMMAPRADELQAELNRRNATRAAKFQQGDLPVAKVSESIVAAQASDVTEEQATSAAKPKFSHQDAANMYLEGNSLEILPRLSKSTTIHHIITDPYFAIDLGLMRKSLRMDRMERQSVEGDLATLTSFLQISYDVIHEAGYLCMWYDLDYHNYLQELAKEIGWIVCRWPFIWCKTSSCKNDAANVNITKATEQCMFLRRSTKSVLNSVMSKNYVITAASPTATHPFYKPESVWSPIIEAVSYPGQTIVDPFAGEGSMMVAGHKLQRRPIGIEWTPEHVQNGIANLTKRLGSSMFMTGEEDPL